MRPAVAQHTPLALPFAASLASAPPPIAVALWVIAATYAAVRAYCWASHRHCALRRDRARTQTFEAVAEERRRPRVLRAAARGNRDSPGNDDSS